MYEQVHYNNIIAHWPLTSVLMVIKYQPKFNTVVNNPMHAYQVRLAPVLGGGGQKTVSCHINSLIVIPMRFHTCSKLYIYKIFIVIFILCIIYGPTHTQITRCSIKNKRTDDIQCILWCDFCVHNNDEAYQFEVSILALLFSSTATVTTTTV